MLRIHAIAPLRLTDEELARRQRRYDLLGGEAVRFTLTNLEADAPARLDTAEDIARSEAAVRRIVRATDPSRYDGILPDCVLDPTVGEPSAVPVFGILRLACGHLSSLGLTFAAVTRNTAIAAELSRRLTTYGLAGSLETVRVLDTDFCLISDDAAWTRALLPVTASLRNEGIGVLVNGCSAVNLPDNRLNGVTLVDPTNLALRLLTTAQHQHLLASPAGRIS